MRLIFKSLLVLTNYFLCRDEEVDLLKNSQHLLPYRSIINALENGAVNLL